MAISVTYNELFVDIPSEFQVMSEEEKVKRNVNTADKESVFYFYEDEHTIIGFHSKKINKLIVFVADRKAMRKRNEIDMKKVNSNVEITKEYEANISGIKCLGFQMEYIAGERKNIGQYLMVIHNGVYYAITLNYRYDNKEYGDMTWNKILDELEIK